MNTISFQAINIVDAAADAVVNAANTGLKEGSGVCGAIFGAADNAKLTAACSAIGYCPEGSAVITPSFGLKHARKIIHAVGPHYIDGAHGEEQILASCYRSALKLAVENGSRSVALPLISSGIFGYPAEEAWRIALSACRSFLASHPDSLDILFVAQSEHKLDTGRQILAQLEKESAKRKAPAPVTEKAPVPAAQEFVFFWKVEEEYGELCNWYNAPFTVEGIRYWCVEQYMMSKKALLFGNTDIYAQIMKSADQHEIKHLGRQVTGFDSDTWKAAREEVVYNACYAKFSQNPALRTKLLATGSKTLAEASPNDKNWGIGLAAEDPRATDPAQWPGLSLLGKLLMRVRDELKG